MKGNINKLAVFVMIAAIMMFTVVTMPSANEHNRKNTFHGEYAVTGTGSCLVAIAGFDASRQPNGGATGPWFWGAMTLDDGVYTFNKDGSGSVKITLHETDLYSSGMGAPPGVGTATEKYNFTYTMDNGKITFTYVTGSYEADWTDGPSANTQLYLILPPWNGELSPNGKILYASFRSPNILDITADKANTTPVGVQAICNIVFQGFRIGP